MGEEGPDERLEVWEYPSPFAWQPYYVVFRDETVAYVIGPVPEGERDPKAVRSRYGKPEVKVEGGTDSLEVFRYPKRKTAFIRKPDHKHFEAKAFGEIAD